MTTISFKINGEETSLTVEPRESLADVLRDRLALTGTHLGCEHGACGACTVELDGKAVRSCLVLGVMADGRSVTTIEGLREDEVMAVLRRQFHEHHALQCGFCTPGMLVMARDLLNRVDNPSEAEVRQGMAGQICRCTGYAGIVRAIRASAEELEIARTAQD